MEYKAAIMIQRRGLLYILRKNQANLTDYQLHSPRVLLHTVILALQELVSKSQNAYKERDATVLQEVRGDNGLQRLGTLRRC